MRNNILLAGVFYTVFFISCKPDFINKKADKGDADFSVYVAMGSSESAGFADFATYDSAQRYCYPAIIAKQLEAVGRKGEFLQPWMPAGYGMGIDQFKNIIPPYKLDYYTDCQGSSILMPVPSGKPYLQVSDISNILNTDLTAITSIIKNIYTSKGFHNMSACGAKSYNYLDKKYGTLGTALGDLQLIIGMLQNGIEQINPLFGRFCSDPGKSSVVDDALKMNGTFFTCWIGCNDVLGYAMEGVEGVGANITDYGVFDQNLQEIVLRLCSHGAKGAIANIPLVNYLTYFNVIKYNDLTYNSYDQDKINYLNTIYRNINPDIIFHTGKNAYVVSDPNASGGVRQIKEGELIPLVLPLDSIKCSGWGTSKPIPEKYYLSQSEINVITDATNHYNQTLYSLAQQFNLAYVDINDFFNRSRSGLWVEGVKFTLDFVKGGVLSLDGIHPSPRGNAIIANEFIREINRHYKSTIPLARVMDYPQIRYPD